jgi:RNA-directed DNA polymerase
VGHCQQPVPSEVWGLTLHPDKTRIGDSEQPSQGFDFLGNWFEAGCRFVRHKSLTAFKDKVSDKTIRGRGDSLERIIAVLNPLLRDGLVTSSTPDRACSGSLTASSAVGCALPCASRSGVRPWGGAGPNIGKWANAFFADQGFFNPSGSFSRREIAPMRERVRENRKHSSEGGEINTLPAPNRIN